MTFSFQITVQQPLIFSTKYFFFALFDPLLQFRFFSATFQSICTLVMTAHYLIVAFLGKKCFLWCPLGGCMIGRQYWRTGDRDSCLPISEEPEQRPLWKDYQLFYQSYRFIDIEELFECIYGFWQLDGIYFPTKVHHQKASQTCVC